MENQSQTEGKKMLLKQLEQLYYNEIRLWWMKYLTKQWYR
jgi:hypothetical protein